MLLTLKKKNVLQEVEKGRQHGNIVARKNLGPRICRKYLGVQTWRVKKEKNIERKERQTGGKSKKSIIYSGLKTTTCLISY